METPADLRYSEEHEWVRMDGDVATIGITAYAQDSLGDIVFVELPAAGRSLAVGDGFGVVESVKAVSDVYSPVSGEIVEVNAALETAPEQVNNAPYGDGWMIKIRVSDPSAVDKLMDAEAYEGFTAH
ncbi:MAG: glycine cleavage system protein GcvH [Thermomicrobia bacterium]|nr:glycine cleavage system protein GcvH [Thermomicrobia bacterium]